MWLRLIILFFDLWKTLNLKNALFSLREFKYFFPIIFPVFECLREYSRNASKQISGNEYYYEHYWYIERKDAVHGICEQRVLHNVNLKAKATDESDASSYIAVVVAVFQLATVAYFVEVVSYAE